MDQPRELNYGYIEGKWAGVPIRSKELFYFDPNELKHLIMTAENIHPNVRILAQNILTIIESKQKPLFETSKHFSLPPEKLKEKYACVQQHINLPTFHNGDIIAYTASLAETVDPKTIAILNPANSDFSGGGAFLGANALEEIYFRSSNLCIAYVQHAIKEGFKYDMTMDPETTRPRYKVPMKVGEAWFTDSITFTQKPAEQKYEQLKEPFTVSIIGSTAPNYHSIPHCHKDTNHQKIVKEEIRAQLTAAIVNGKTTVVLTAFGCGAFNNDPRRVAQYYWDVLYKEGYYQFFNGIHFAILNDRGKQPNFDIFEEVFKANFKCISSQYQVMEFVNNYLVKRFMEPTIRLNRDWESALFKAQKTVQIYHKKDLAIAGIQVFNRLGRYPLEVFFGDNIQRPKIIAKVDSYQDFLAPDHENAHGRVNTKFRVIFSEIPFLNKKGELITKKVITACAPNFSGTSPGDEKEFIKNGVLNVLKYLQVCLQLADLIVYAAKNNGLSSLGIAEFGLGVYLNRLDPQQKEFAQICMYHAFAAASKYHEVKIDWILYHLTPQVDKIAAKWNLDYKSKYFEFRSGDIFDCENFLNNGSDRTIGGQFVVSDPKTTEEQLAQQSFLLLIQTTLNPILQENKPLVVPTDDNIVLYPVLPFKISSIYVSYNCMERMVRFQFVDIEEAKKFIAPSFLSKIDIYKENDLFTVDLNEDQYNIYKKDELAFDVLLSNWFMNHFKLDLNNHANLGYWDRLSKGIESTLVYAKGNKKYKLPILVFDIYNMMKSHHFDIHIAAVVLNELVNINQYNIKNKSSIFKSEDNPQLSKLLLACMNLHKPSENDWNFVDSDIGSPLPK